MTNDICLKIYHELCIKKLRLSVAESLTGGVVCSALIGVDGISKFFHEGIVAYSNESKIARLKVSLESLMRYGAVSEKIAAEMAEGLLSDADVAVSTTGIAGSGGGSAEKPIGLTYIAVADSKSTEVFRYIFEGGRNEVREQAAHTALQILLKKLQTN